jgi:hypothetical protein
MRTKAADAPGLDELLPLFAKVRPGVAPNWTTRYKIGAALSKHMDPCCTLEELGAELGVTKQNAYTESVLALGTLACALYVRMHFGRHPLSASNTETLH